MLGGKSWFGIVAGGRGWGVGDEIERRVVGITENRVRLVVGGVGCVVWVVLWRW